MEDLLMETLQLKDWSPLVMKATLLPVHTQTTHKQNLNGKWRLSEHVPMIMLDSCSPLPHVDPSTASLVYHKMQPSGREVESRTVVPY